LSTAGTDHERAWLGRFPEADAARLAERMEFYPNGHPDQQSAWSWSWLFLQKPSDTKGHAPIVLPIERPRFDLTWRTGKLKVERALENFDYYVRRFGLGDQPNEDGQGPCHGPRSTPCGGLKIPPSRRGCLM
jgi:hypothetical protein